MALLEGRRLLVLFGSETGSAQDVAEEIGREAELYHIQASVLPMDSYEIVKLPTETFVIFVVATAGQGEFPSNAIRFWRFLLRKNLPKESLMHLRVGICGLGDSGYKEFNYAAKKLHRRLLQLSARIIVPPAYGDDQHSKGQYQILDPWRKLFFSELLYHLPLPSGVEKRKEQKPLPRYQIEYGEINDEEDINYKQEAPFSQENPYLASLLANEKLSAPDWKQDIRHYVIELQDTSLSFSPGDALAILPCNPEEEVRELLQRLALDGDTVIQSLTPTNPHRNEAGPKSLSAVKFPISLKKLLTDHLDIMGTPRRYFYKQLSYFTSAEHEKERLEYFASAEAQDEVRSYAQKEKKSILEILQDFPSSQIPLDFLVDLIPPIQPRLFSISSSFKYKANRAELLVAKVDFVTPYKKARRGLCTHWLSQCSPSDKLRVWIKKGSPHFHLPPKLSTPIIMVGPGTGLAPFRSFIQEREWHRNNGDDIGTSLLFTGCRHKEKDWCYGEELQEFEKKNSLSRYCVAFSRDNLENKSRKTYVQDLIEEHSNEVWNALEEGGHFYLSGSAKIMPQNVKDAIKEVIMKEGKKTEEKAEIYIKKLLSTARYTTETWQ